MPRTPCSPHTCAPVHRGLVSDLRKTAEYESSPILGRTPASAKLVTLSILPRTLRGQNDLYKVLFQTNHSAKKCYSRPITVTRFVIPDQSQCQEMLFQTNHRYKNCYSRPITVPGSVIPDQSQCQ